MVEDEWLSAGQIADYLCVRKGTVYKWIATRDIPAHKIGNVWKFRIREIDEWVNSTGARDTETEKINTDKPLCKMILRSGAFSPARLNVKLNWRFRTKSTACTK